MGLFSSGKKPNAVKQASNSAKARKENTKRGDSQKSSERMNRATANELNAINRQHGKKGGFW